jgi:carboxymethylenebutenolidase
VLLLHPWWGLNDTMKATCAQLADEGFLVFAPDLYHGKIAATIQEAEALSNALDGNQAMVEITQAVAYLTEHLPLVAHDLAVIGFSLGVFFALELSVVDPEHVRSVVIFYGTRPGEYDRSRAEYLGHFAETDEFEPRSSVDELEAALRRARRPLSFHHYPGTGHWFFEPDRPAAYQRAAATLAWKRTLAFLKGETTL